MFGTDLFSLKGKVAVVTGGSEGIGKMIAQGFIYQGATVYISARTGAACQQVAESLSQGGGKCIALPADVSTVAGAKALAADFSAREPSLDILVNNAAVWCDDAFDDFPEEKWDPILALNFKGPFFVTQALAPALRRAASHLRPAKVINIASIDGIYLTHRNSFSYSSTKAGLIQLTRMLAAQLIADHICVSAIAPGSFPSRMNREAAERGEEAARHIPARRVGAAEDIAGAAIFLASRAGDYVVGATITVDGGLAYATRAPRQLAP